MSLAATRSVAAAGDSSTKRPAEPRIRAEAGKIAPTGGPVHLYLVVNPAAGVGAQDPITMDEINAVLAASSAKVLAILDDLVHTRATFAN